MNLNDVIPDHMTRKLVRLCQQELGINELPQISFVDELESTFGQFDGESILVATAGRHPMDVMRTLAHEIVHWKQKLNGEDMDGSDGSDIENEANAVAGVVMRRSGKMYPDYFVSSMYPNS